MSYVVWTLMGLVIGSAVCSMYLSVRRPGPWSMWAGALLSLLLGTEFLVVGEPRWIVLFSYAVALLSVLAALARSKVDALARTRKTP